MPAGSINTWNIESCRQSTLYQMPLACHHHHNLYCTYDEKVTPFTRKVTTPPECREFNFFYPARLVKFHKAFYFALTRLIHRPEAAK